MTTKRDKTLLKEAVLLGVHKALTAKETAYETGYKPWQLTEQALKMGLAFKWAKIAKIPMHSGPIPTETIIKRERESVRLLMIRMESALEKLEPEHPAASILITALGKARIRNTLRT
jgi:hypothetical protein